MDELNPNVNKPKEFKTENSKMDTIALSGWLDQVRDSLFMGFEAYNWDTVLYPDRFRPKGVQKVKLKLNQDSVLITHYRLNDSVSVNNLFFNWLDVLGKRETPIQIGGKLDFSSQLKSAFILVGKKEIQWVQSTIKINESTWRKALIADSLNDNWTYVITRGKGMRVNWSSIKNGRVVPLIK